MTALWQRVCGVRSETAHTSNAWSEPMDHNILISSIQSVCAAPVFMCHTEFYDSQRCPSAPAALMCAELVIRS